MSGATLMISSDIVGGVSGILLAAASNIISSFAYPRLMGKSAAEAVASGKTIEASYRSINSVRNWLGFWTISLSMLAHLLAFCLEFGILGVSESITYERPAVILGGGRRFSNNHTADGSIFTDSSQHLPAVFSAAVGGCLTVETDNDFKMIKNQYPAIDVSQNSSGTYVSEFERFECTSSWLGSAEWIIESSGDLIIDLETVTEQYRYEDNVVWAYESGGLATMGTDLLTISYGLGTSYRGDNSPVVLVNMSDSSSDFLGAGISISEESGHYVYSLSTSLEQSSIDGTAVLSGTYMRGHYRSSDYSLGGVVCLMLTMLLIHANDSLSGVFTISDTWWESESRHGDYLIHSNPVGSEQSWPSLTDASGNVHTEYAKGTEPKQFPFNVGEREVTVVSYWCLVSTGILALVVVTLTAASIYLVKTKDNFWTYDGLSRMVSGWDNPNSLAMIGVVGGEGSKRIGLVASET